MIKQMIEKLFAKYIILQNLLEILLNTTRGTLFGGYIMVPNKSNCTLKEVLSEYRFYDIHSTDMVLDIGANVGGFSLFMSKNVKHIYAVEPLFTDTLQKNINNNNIKNITVINKGLGDSPFLCEFGDLKKRIDCISLTEILKLCDGKIDFLKCDCEGGEWNIKPHELNGIRRLEVEVHSFNGEQLTDFSDMLIELGYNVVIDYRSNKSTMLIHACESHTAQKEMRGANVA